MKSVAQFTQEIRDQTWPGGEPENLVAAHDLHFQEAFAEVAKWVEGEQENNVNLVAFCKTKYKCGMTVVQAPRGVVRRLSVIANNDFCDPVIYRQVDWPVPECAGRQYVAFGGQLTVNGKLPLGFSDADAANDSKCGRSRTGIWAVYHGNLYIAPWIQSMEAVVIEWDGIKTEWAKDDPVLNEDQDYRKAIKSYFQFCHERDFGDLPRAMMWHNPGAIHARGLSSAPGQFDLALADLMWADRERTKTRATKQCFPDMDVPLHATVQETGIPPAAAGALLVAHLGKLEGSDADILAARAMAQLQGPVAIFAAGLLRPPSGYQHLTVANAGSAVNGTLDLDTLVGLINGRPAYGTPLGVGGVNDPGGDGILMYWNGATPQAGEVAQSWTLAIMTGGSVSSYYYSTDDVVTPDLISTWHAYAGAGSTGTGVLPLPVLTPSGPTGNLASAYDDTIGLGFFDFLAPYAGVHGEGAAGTAKNMFWPAPNALDWDRDSTLALYKTFFAARTTDYYEVCIRNAHFFVVSGDAREPDGNGTTSAQAEWLKIKLKLSTATWKIVVIGDSPYSSVRQNALLRWDFKTWGADLVLSSGAVNYERLSVGGLPYIVNGLGCAGSTIIAEPVTTVATGSVAHYSSGPALGLLSILGNKLSYQLLTPAGAEVDSVSLTK